MEAVYFFPPVFFFPVTLHCTHTILMFIICKTKQLVTDLFHCFFNLLTFQFSLCSGVLSLSPFVLFDTPYHSSPLFRSVFPSQADSYPVLPYGLEEFPNGHSDLYHAAWKLWVFFSSASSFCLTLPLFISTLSQIFSFCLACEVSNLATFQEIGSGS